MGDVVELGASQDVWADGIARIEISGQIFRTIYYKWALMDGVWRKMTLDFAIVRPREALFFGKTVEDWPFPVIERVTGRGLN